MAVFAYTALSKEGQRTSGTLAADSRSAALMQMSRQGLHPVSLAEAKNAVVYAETSGCGKCGQTVGRVSQKAFDRIVHA